MPERRTVRELVRLMEDDGWLVIVEEGEDNLSAYSPDLPGCIATGETYDETLQNMYEAIQFHLEAMLEDGEPIPHGFSLAAYLTLPDPVAAMTPVLA